MHSDMTLASGSARDRLVPMGTTYSKVRSPASVLHRPSMALGAARRSLGVPMGGLDRWAPSDLPAFIGPLIPGIRPRVNRFEKPDRLEC